MQDLSYSYFLVLGMTPIDYEGFFGSGVVYSFSKKEFHIHSLAKMFDFELIHDSHFM